MEHNLAESLFRHSRERPRAVALRVGDEALDYAALAAFGQKIAAWLLRQGTGAASRVGVLGGRTLGTYLGVISACWAGATYVPLGHAWPEARLILTLRKLRLDALIVDAACAARLSPSVLAACPAVRLVAEPSADLATLPDAPDLAPVARPGSHIAYIIFTSGSTGLPKAVQISLASILGHLTNMQEIYQFTPGDRISLASELSFDPSILNMFMAWGAGAALHVVPPAELASPLGFIQKHALTVWNSTPATINLLLWMQALQPGCLPSLRISIFGGDTLRLEAALAWQRAAPFSVVDNVYGPTETTIECLHQRLTDPPVVTPERGSLALGLPYPGTTIAILDQQRRPVPFGETGELAVAGGQLAAGYLDQPDLTSARFPVIGGVRWYLTGDLAYQDAHGRVHHLGRADDQIKIRGHRVELGEVEASLRAVCGTDQVAAIAWPVENGAPIGLVGFYVPAPRAPSPATRAIRAALANILPPYMVPQAIHAMDALPLTPHGKIDRAGLAARLDQAAAR